MENKKDKMYGFRFLKFILGSLFKLYYNPTIIGEKNIPEDGPIIVVGNHKHVMDQCLPIIATKRPIHYMAKREYFDDKRVAWFFKLAGCISVDRSKKDDTATSEALEVLNKGFALGLFPEGTRNRTDKLLLPFKFGAVSMAKKTDAFLVPFGITGQYKFRSKDLVIRIGKPIKVGDDLEIANKELEAEVARLMRESLENSGK